MEPKRPTFSDSWHRVESLTPRLRPGVTAQRRHFRGELWHILEDPLGAGKGGRAGGHGAFFRLNESAYRFVGLLDGRRTVARAWRLACEALGDDAPTQPEAVALLGQLGGANLLQGDLPEDARALFRRYRARKSRELRGVLTSLLSIRLPFIDPDRFLNVVAPVFGRAFSWWGLIAWLVLVAVGLAHALERPVELWNGVGGVLDAANLGWLYGAFLLAKVVHELGHGVACKWFSRLEGQPGPVHAMGAMLLVFMPAPFVDATCAWAIRSKWARIAVGAAGMYAELALAAVAAVVWARTGEGTVAHAVAYNLMFIAGVSTIVFNANPLMKYDGYFMLADLLETPNLAQRSREQFHHIVQRRVWRVRESVSPAHTMGEAAWLTAYHLASAAYRAVVFVAITFFVMDHWLLAGVLIGAFLFVAQVGVPVGKLWVFIASSPRLEKTRSLAAWSTAAAALAALALVSLVPVPDRVRIEGVIEACHEEGVFAPEDGFVERAAEAGGAVDGSAPAVLIGNEAIVAERESASARLGAARLRYGRAVAEDPARARDEAELVVLSEAALRRIDRRVSSLAVHPAVGGVWVPAEGVWPGLFVRKGQKLGTVTDAAAISARCAADQRTAALLTSYAEGLPSARAELRARGDADQTVSVIVSAPAPAGRTSLTHAALGDHAGGPIRLSPLRAPDAKGGAVAAEPYFEVPVTILGGESTGRLRPGQRVVVRIDLPRSALLVQWVRAIRQTFQQRFSV